MQKKYKLILFDIDGTIANTDKLLVKSFKILSKKYGYKKIPKKLIYTFSGPPIKGSLLKCYPTIDNEIAVNDYKKISWDLYSSVVKTYKNCKKVLKLLKKYGYKLGIVSNKSKKSAEHCIKCLKMDDLFEKMVCYEDVKNVKPSSEGILKAMDVFCVNDRNDVIYIGDNSIDVLAASNAKVDSILCTWGPRKFDNTIKATYYAKSFNDIRRILL